MKTSFCLASVTLLMLLSLAPLQSATAQINININPPSWGPAAPAGAQYYYVPEYGGYYDLRAQQYVVQREGKWQRLRALNGYNPSNFHPVVINYAGATPWANINEHKTRYGHPHGMPPGQAKKMRGGAARPAGGIVVVDPTRNDYGRGKPGKGKGKH
jgi:hypothetical protein